MEGTLTIMWRRGIRSPHNNDVSEKKRGVLIEYFITWDLSPQLLVVLTQSKCM
jgi:hypothetical protein